MKKSFLIYRFSALGDVVLTIPILHSFMNQFPEQVVVFATREAFVPFIPARTNLKVIGFNLDKYKGIKGLYQIYREIENLGPYERVFDLHQVIRTRVLNSLFIFNGTPVSRIKKPRKERKSYLRNPTSHQVTPTIEIYQKAFIQSGYSIEITPPPYSHAESKQSETEQSVKKKIGVAPFSRHATKTWPLKNFFDLINQLQSSVPAHFYIFSSSVETDKISDWQNSHITIVARNFNTEAEIALIHDLDLMISLDSANMHLADLAGIPVLSIWGGTQPGAGFKPYFQPSHHQITTNMHYSCQPCSIYGRAGCSLQSDPYGCLKSISVKEVFQAALRILQ